MLENRSSEQGEIYNIYNLIWRRWCQQDIRLLNIACWHLSPLWTWQPSTYNWRYSAYVFDLPPGYARDAWFVSFRFCSPSHRQYSQNIVFNEHKTGRERRLSLNSREKRTPYAIRHTRIAHSRSMPDAFVFSFAFLLNSCIIPAAFWLLSPTFKRVLCALNDCN